MKNDVRFKFVSWENVGFCFISIAWVHFIHKTEISILKVIEIL